MEFKAEKKFKHEPTENEILYQMPINGLSLNDVVTIDKGYELDRKYDD